MCDWMYEEMLEVSPKSAEDDTFARQLSAENIIVFRNTTVCNLQIRIGVSRTWNHHLKLWSWRRADPKQHLYINH
jgi:hypothetical protein